ncbi:MAG: GIY-YIG nuclease family protein [Bacteroidota bacterium]
MKLAYGQQGGHLIHVSEVERGQSGCYCPYCGVAIIPKKGKVMAHHFAHRGKSCWQPNAYDFFGLEKQLPLYLDLETYAHETYAHYLKHNRQLSEQQQHWQQRQASDQEAIRQYYTHLRQQRPSDYQLLRLYLVDEAQTLPDFNYPKKIYFALQNFHTQQYRLREIEDKLSYFEEDAIRFRKFMLYFLKIQVSVQAVIYKIGITARALELRLAEIERDLRWHFPQLDIQVLFTLSNAAFLENFFKQKYQQHRYELAQFTEYFVLPPHEVDQILSELNRISKLKSYQSFCS